MLRNARRAVPIVALAAATTALSGCSLIATPEPESTASALETCAVGHVWALDTTNLGQAVVDEVDGAAVQMTVVVDGSQQLDWSSDYRMTFTTDLTYRASTSIGGWEGYEEDIRVTGTSTGLAYFSGAVAVPRNWSEEDLVVERTASRNGESVEATTGWRFPTLWIDDTHGLEVGCADGVLTLTARQTKLTWTYSLVE